MATWKQYTISNEQTFSGLLDGEGDWPEDNEIAAFANPEDEELQCSLLAADWNGHKTGTRLLHTLSLRNYRFWIECD